MMSTKSELNQSPGGTPNLESPGESYEPLKSRERATGKRDPRDEANLHKQLRRPSILYSLRSSSRDEQLSCSDHLHRRPVREVMQRQKNRRRKQSYATWTNHVWTPGLRRWRRPMTHRRVAVCCAG